MDSIIGWPTVACVSAAETVAASGVDGGAGIARRIAYLTREQPWPSEPSPGIALFTRALPNGPLLRSLARYGLDVVRTL